MREIQLNIVLIKRKSCAQINGIISKDVQQSLMDKIDGNPKEREYEREQIVQITISCILMSISNKQI